MNFIEESNKYIIRGLFYLIGWFLVTPIIFAGIGGALFGVAGLVIGIISSVVLGVWGYAAYLKWNERKMLLQPLDTHGVRP